MAFVLKHIAVRITVSHHNLLRMVGRPSVGDSIGIGGTTVHIRVPAAVVFLQGLHAIVVLQLQAMKVVHEIVACVGLPSNHNFRFGRVVLVLWRMLHGVVHGRMIVLLRRID